MPEKKEPLLLLDNSTMYVVGAGDYHSTNLSFEEAKAIIDMYETEDILRCFTDRSIEDVLHEYVGIERRDFAYKPVRKMRVGQDAIAIKLYVTKSETQPEVETEDGVAAKKFRISMCIVSTLPGFPEKREEHWAAVSEGYGRTW